MCNHQVIHGSAFAILLVVAEGCGSSANDAGVNVGGSTTASGSVVASAGGASSMGGRGISGAGGIATAITTGSPVGGGIANGGMASTLLGGNANTGGTSVAASTAILGQQCSPPGSLGCNGTNQKLTLVCGASGTWQTNQTCNSATQVCDPRPGNTQGTCQEQDALCAAATAGQQFCNEYAEWRCDAWGMKASKVRECPIGACANGKCLDSSTCLTEWNFLSCSSDCASTLDKSTRCFENKVSIADPPTDGVNGSAIVHVAYSSSTAVTDSECPLRRYTGIVATFDPAAYLRVQVQGPWQISESLSQTRCDHGYPGVSCDIVKPGNGVVSVWTDDPAAPPANVSVIASPTKPTCPPI